MLGLDENVGGPIGLIKNGDKIIVDLNKNKIECEQLKDNSVYKKRKNEWDNLKNKNNGLHPSIGEANTRLLNRMRLTAVPAYHGAGMHPNIAVVRNGDPITINAKRRNFGLKNQERYKNNFLKQYRSINNFHQLLKMFSSPIVSFCSRKSDSEENPPSWMILSSTFRIP